MNAGTEAFIYRFPKDKNTKGDGRMFKKLKENKKKGFTLVELIVVLVILAILAALLIPALTGYIDKAKDKQITAETRQVVMAAQTLADEAYAKNSGDTITVVQTKSGTPAAKTVEITKDEITTLAEVNGTIGTVTFDTTTKGKIATLEYTNGGKKCTYTAANAEKYAIAAAQ